MIGAATSYPEINALLGEVYAGAQPILGDHFIGIYLDGSLASGAFDQDSDIDFIVVSDIGVSGEIFDALQAMHDRIAQIDSPWAIQLEGFYISLPGIRRWDPALAQHANIERGEGERLKMIRLDQTWDVHRYILRKQGITLAGPAPDTLIDPVGSAQLERAALCGLSGWATHVLDDEELIHFRGYQSYVVLTLCRMLYTLQNDEVGSKPVAARWAQAALGERWASLIERAWEGRHNSGGGATPEDIEGTREFIRFALDYGRRWAPK